MADYAFPMAIIENWPIKQEPTVYVGWHVASSLEGSVLMVIYQFLKGVCCTEYAFCALTPLAG